MDYDFLRRASIIKFVENERTIMAMCGLALMLSTASLLLLVISL